MTSNNELRKRGTTIKATLQVGKAGITESTVAELKAQLEKKELIKVKVLSTGAEGGERKALFEQLAASAGSELIEVRGGTALFYMPKKGRRP